jgi:N-ethylmaleimide reductase
MLSAIAVGRKQSDLFQPLKVGPCVLANRIVMAPLTRSRASPDGIPPPITVEYYEQRASAGLIIAEATNISPQARGYAFTPGIYNEPQFEAWQNITEAVHNHGGHIFLQLWHVGRMSHPSLQPGGALPVAPSAIRPQATAYTETGFQPCVTPRALETEEIPAIIDQYCRAAKHALAAGFDGVEIHAANGYLIEQFLRNSTNKRNDAYGGSREKRSRFLLEVTEAVARVCGAERVGIRLSPISPANDIGPDNDAEAAYSYVVEHLNPFGLAYIHIIEGQTQGGPREVSCGFDLHILRRAFKGLYIANNGYDLTLALDARHRNLADLISFGRLYIANPDLVERLRIGARLNVPDRTTFFGRGTQGYTDYPFLTPEERSTA